MPLTKFDSRISITPEPWKSALVAVCDVAETIKFWLDDRQVPYVAADIVALTNLVLQRERETRPVETDGE